MHPNINIGITAVRNASKIIMRSLERLENPRLNMDSRKNLVARIEESASQEIIDTIHNAYPEHKIAPLAEETTDEEAPVWVINTIDSIRNYAHAIPHFAISVAIRHKRKIQHSIIYDPIRQELFTASRGSGAVLNNRRTRVSINNGLDNCILGTNSNFPCFPFPETTYINRSGSPTLDMVYVAAGRLDGFIGTALNEQELTAPALLIQEAGGLISAYNGEENYLSTGNIVTGNPKIFKTILQFIQKNREINNEK